jgi:anion-transporting  ArsA/GET3 family ATPase
MEESAIFDAVVDIIVKGDYDYYIYDLVPLGHALYYLSMAKVYDEWINKITKLREEMGQYDQVAATLRRQESVEEDKILEELRYIKNRINTSSQILTDKQRTAFFFVLVPEEMIILDTRKAAELFARFDVPISGYVVNRVLPPELRAGNIPAYLKSRFKCRKISGDIRNSLGGEVSLTSGDGAGYYRAGDDRTARGKAVQLVQDVQIVQTVTILNCMSQITTSMTGYFRGHPKLKFLFFGGKGGVGKTALAGATALWLAGQGRRTLLASTNPVHSLSGLLEKSVFGAPTAVSNNLWAYEIDTKETIERSKKEIREKIQWFLKFADISTKADDFVDRRR